MSFERNVSKRRHRHAKGESSENCVSHTTHPLMKSGVDLQLKNALQQHELGTALEPLHYLVHGDVARTDSAELGKVLTKLL